MKKLLLIFVLMLASCGDACNCEYLSGDPFNSSTLPNGCGCSVVKLYVPDITSDIGADVGAEVKNTTDLSTGHKVK
tara:strand:- start:91 stop:318 length:228 start_codon:yes stop_codon:yes gene_type:complete